MILFVQIKCNCFVDDSNTEIDVFAFWGGRKRFLVGNKLVMQRKWGKLFIQSRERRRGAGLKIIVCFSWK